MSRAREATHAWVVADDPAEDLRRDWSARRTPTWALGTCLPTTTLREAVVSMANPGQARVVALPLARSRVTDNATAQLQPVDLAPELSKARAALRHVEQARVDLLAGRGAYLGTEAGQAVSDLARAEAGLAAARRAAENGSHWWGRRAEAKEAAAWAERHADARRRWLDHVAPEAARLDAAIGLRRDEVERLNASVERQAARSAGVTDLRRLSQGFVRLSSRRSRTVPARPGQPRRASCRACSPIALSVASAKRVLFPLPTMTLAWTLAELRAHAGGPLSLLGVVQYVWAVASKRGNAAPNADYVFVKRQLVLWEKFA